MKSFLKPVFKLLNDAFGNFQNILKSTKEFQKFVEANGWIASDVEDTQLALVRSAINVTTLIDQIKDLAHEISDGKTDTEDLIEDAIPLVESLYTTIDNIASINYASFSVFPLNQSLFWTELSQNLVPYVLANYLKKNSKITYSILYFFGIIDYVTVTPSGPNRIKYIKTTIDWDVIGSLFTAPNQLLKTRYNWGNGSNVNSAKLFSVLQDIFSNYYLNTKTILISDLNYQNYISSNTALANNTVYQFELPLVDYWHPQQNNLQKFNIEILPIPRNNSTSLQEGLLIKPSIEGSTIFFLPLSNELFLKGVGYFASDNLLDFQLFPDTSKLTLNGLSSLGTSSKVSLIALPKVPWLLIGDYNSTRLLVNGIETSIEIKGDLNDPEIILRVGGGDTISGPFVHFIFSPGEGDNFIKKILGSTSFNIDFGFTLKWSSKNGIGFEGNSGFSILIPLHGDKNNGNFPLKLDALKISAGSNNGNFKIGIGTNILFKLGAVSASISDIGVNINLKKKSGPSKGIFGNLDFDFSFRPPSGLGISIEADPVSGGGFLNFDEATATYTGALQLKFSEISLNAIGILTTKMPDGSDGYSLLIIITADFTPIQLGMGFTLNGVGGLLGLNRTMNTDRLRSGVKDGSLDYILFPQNVVANANAIISNISQAFPVQQGQFLIGPMAKIGWGTPTLLTIELGVIIQMPSPVVIAILGVIKALLPSENNKILSIQVNFLGIIDFGKKYLSFDASLYDSKILTFGLTGDMALRLYWGDNPSFLLSVGGFHPKFTPPPTMNLPTMQRLAIVLANDNNLKISAQTYFAVTSNTAQFGASITARAKAWKIEAVGAVWFDVLFQFSPFYFNADMGAMFAVKMGSKTVLSIYVDLSLEGPNPWRAQGRASFKIVLVRVNVSFDKTFGQVRVEAVATVNVMPQLEAAIQNKDNWVVTGPDRSHQVVTFREIAAVAGQLIVDPFGTLKFTQKVVPIGITISKFGTSAIADDNSFSIGAVTSGSVTLPSTPVQDYFAPNSFFYLTDDQKLSRASYERYNSGVAIGNTDEVLADFCVHRLIGYEDIILDVRQRVRFSAMALMSAQQFQMHTMANHVSDSPLSLSSGRVPPEGPRRVVVNNDSGFVLANINTLGQVGTDVFLNYAEAQVRLNTLRTTDPANAVNYMIANTYELV